jgi:short-subunit dehydrogenase
VTRVEFANKTVWITGASRGIGEAVARKLIDKGATVYGSGRTADALDAIAASTSGFHPLVVDVTDLDAMKAAAATITDQRDKIDLAIFNAGTWRPIKVRNFDSSVIAATLETNVMGLAHGIEAVLGPMIDRGSGTIAGVASVAGYRGLPNAAAYSSSKAAMIALLESLRIDAGRHGVKVVTINPGFVDTELTERNTFRMPFIISSEAAADSILKGLERNQNEIVFPLPMTLLMKAMRLLPVTLHAEAFKRFGRP